MNCIVQPHSNTNNNNDMLMGFLHQKLHSDRAASMSHTSTANSATVPHSSNNSAASASSSTFPMKLHTMLSDSELMGFDDVVCWLPGGQAFKVLDPTRFAEEIMPQYFNQTKYKSFQRQLNIYGFQRVHHGPQKGGYTHKYCVQGFPELCEQIKRESVTTASNSQEATHKRVISSENQVNVDLGFAWDVEAEQALEDEEASAPQSSACGQYSHQRTITPMFTSTPLASLYPTPLPFPGSAANKSLPMAQPAGNVLDENDISFFKTLFQPGDAAAEKDILDSFFLDSMAPASASPQAQTTLPIAPRHAYATPVAPTTACVPSVAAGAVSEYNFPRKLYRLLQDCETNPEYQSIVSWSADGKSFKVHCKKRFVEVILPNYFDQTQYASFRRQLNMYSFVRQSMSTYSNPCFMRGHRELLDRVVRKSGNSSKSE